MAINKISEAERVEMKKKSAQSLPDVPSIMNWTPQEFKNSITKVLFDNSNSFYYYINRLTDEVINTYGDYYTKEQLDALLNNYYNKAYIDLQFGNLSSIYLSKTEADQEYLKKGEAPAGAVTQKQLQDGLATKVDKVTETTTYDQVYVKKADGTQEMVNVNAWANNNAIARYTSAGRLKAQNASENNDVPNFLQVKNYVADAIKGASSINILNKDEEVIECTLATVQTVCTNYIVENYGRQPKTYDGLIVTLTDQENDKVWYMYTENSSSWINVGSDVANVGLSNYYTKDETYSKSEVYTKTETITAITTNTTNKLNKLTSTSGEYAYTRNGSTDTSLQISDAVTNETLVKRTSTGQILANPAVNDNDVVVLKQMNTSINTAVANAVKDKQDKLTAGTGIKITNNVISIDLGDYDSEEF